MNDSTKVIILVIILGLALSIPAYIIGDKTAMRACNKHYKKILEQHGIIGNTSLTCQQFNPSQFEIPVQDFQDISAITYAFANSREYNNETYDCVNYSRDYKKMMEELGIETYIIERHNWTHGHAWNKVCVQVEPINAQIIDYCDTYPEEYD